jgi:hypothetical protein
MGQNRPSRDYKISLYVKSIKAWPAHHIMKHKQSLLHKLYQLPQIIEERPLLIVGPHHSCQKPLWKCLTNDGETLVKKSEVLTSEALRAKSVLLTIGLPALSTLDCGQGVCWLFVNVSTPSTLE